MNGDDPLLQQLWWRFVHGSLVLTLRRTCAIPCFILLCLCVIHWLIAVCVWDVPCSYLPSVAAEDRPPSVTTDSGVEDVDSSQASSRRTSSRYGSVFQVGEDAMPLPF